MASLRARTESACPFIDRNDARCAHRFSLSRLQQAFDVCLNAYPTCPMYHQLDREQRRDSPSLTIHLTVEGRTLRLGEPQRRAVALRATGS